MKKMGPCLVLDVCVCVCVCEGPSAHSRSVGPMTHSCKWHQQCQPQILPNAAFREGMCVCPGCAAWLQTDKGVPSRFASKCVFSEIWGQFGDFLFSPLTHTSFIDLSGGRQMYMCSLPSRSLWSYLLFKVLCWAGPWSLQPSWTEPIISSIYAAGGLKVSDLNRIHMDLNPHTFTHKNTD